MLISQLDSHWAREISNHSRFSMLRDLETNGEKSLANALTQLFSVASQTNSK